MKAQRFSAQRERIYQAVCASEDHPTAQMIYDTLRPELPRLSLGTVYRNLHQMAEEGRLRELDGAIVRFDATLPLHSHIRCISCGHVADAELPYDDDLDRSAEEQGWMITGHNLMFNGICPACAGK